MQPSGYSQRTAKEQVRDFMVKGIYNEPNEN